MFKLAYVDKAKIENSIAQQVIPEESLIVTNSEAKNAELSYYDEKGNLKSIVKKTKFESESEARLWIAKYGNYEGETISIKDKDGNWNSYNIGANGEMNQVPNTESLTDILNGLIIDGGRAPTA